MTGLPYYHVDAFTGRLFSGNPAGVCLLKDWPPDLVLQKVAAENNLSETAFLLDRRDHFDLRWFTPKVEVDLCGHATLASAHIVFGRLRPKDNEVRFETRSGALAVKRAGDLLVMDFPTLPARPCEAPSLLLQGLHRPPREVLKAHDYLCVYDNEEDVRSLWPDFEALDDLEDCRGVIVTAPGTDADFVSRFFAPQAGIPEDPVTGSAHCTLTPYWSQRLRKKELLAHQVSARGGELFCTDRGERTLIAGHAVSYLEGIIRMG